MAGRNKLFSKHLICLLLTDLDINLMKRIIDSLDNLHHGLHRLLQLKLTISTAGECVWQVLEQELILCQPLHWLEKIRGKRQLMSQLLLTAQQDGMVISHLRQGCLGRLHVLTVSEIIVCLYYTVIISQYTQWGMGTWNFIQFNCQNLRRLKICPLFPAQNLSSWSRFTTSNCTKSNQVWN